VRCHRAFLLPSGPECYFINVANLSLQRDAEITHVWIQAQEQIPVINPSRSLPKRLQPEESWETWIAVASLPSDIREDAFERARVRLSNGHTLESSKNLDVPVAGHVPGS